MSENVFPDSVVILGTKYAILKKAYEEDEAFEKAGIDGYCDGMTKKIVVCDMDTFKGWENENEDTKRANERHTLRHEIVHAFFSESGLMSSAHRSERAISEDEELIDFIAIQGPKIYKAWEKTNCLDKM